MLIKSSMESEELAYDTANIVYKRVGPTYDKWWMKEGYGQNYAWVVAEHSDYSVRLFFEFMDTGFCYVKVHFTNGASYEDLIADSWNYAKESPEYPFEETCDHVRNFLDNFFEVGGGMDKLRAKYEKGNNSYDVDSYIEKDGYVKNSRKPVKSAVDNISKVRVNLDGNDTLLDLFESVGVYDSTRYDYSVESFAEACKNVLGKGKTHSYISNKDTVIIETKYGFIELIPMEHDFESASDVKLYFDTFMSNGVKSSRKPIKSGLQDGEVIFRASTRGGKNTVEVIDTGDSVDRYAIKQDGSMDYADTTKGVLAKLLKQAGWKEDTFSKIDVDTTNIGIDYLQIVKMINDEFGFLYKSPKGSRERQFYFDIIRFIAQNIERGSDMAIEDMIWKAKDALRAKGINSSRKAIKSSAQSDYDKGADYAEEQYQKYIEGGIDAEDIAAPADCSNDFFNGFNDKILEYKISSSRKPVKSSVAPDGLTFESKDNSELFKGYTLVEYKVTDENILDKIKEVCEHNDDELQLGNVFIQMMYDDSNTFVAGMVVDTESSTWDLSSEECIEIFGPSIKTFSDPSVGKHAVDEFMDFDVDPETVKSSRKPIKSANYNGFNLEARRSYGKGNGYFTTYPVWDTDLDTSIGAIEYHYAVENPYYVAWVYNDFGVNKTGRTKAFDTEEECLEWIGEELASGTTARDKLLKYWEELGYDYKSKNLNNSRKPVKSSFIVGKQDNGSKLYYCEDNCFYDENNYTRPSIKIFNSKQEADKIAKRSKSGFVSPLEK